MRIFTVSVVFLCFTLPALAQQAEPITLSNVNKLGVLQQVSFPSTYVDLELGPQPGELLLHLRNRVAIANYDLKIIRDIDKTQSRGLSFSRDREMVSWMQGKKIVLQNKATRKVLEIEGGEDPGSAVFSPDNSVVAIADMISTEGGEGSGYSLLRIFDTTSGELIKKLEVGMKGYGFLSPVFSPDGKVLAVGNRNSVTKLYDTESWTLTHTLPKRMTHEIAFSPDGKTLAAAYVDGSIGLWDVSTGKSLHMVESGCFRIHSIAWNPTGDLLATSGPSGNRHARGNTWIKQPGRVQLWNAEKLTLARDLMDVIWSASVRFSPDGERLFANVTRRDKLEPGCEVCVWATNAPQANETEKLKVNLPKIPLAKQIKLPDVSAPVIAVSNDGKQVVAPLRSDDRIARWNIATGEQELVFKGEHDWQIWSVAFSPDGTNVATASLDKTIKLWDAKTGDLLATLQGHTDRVEYLSYSPDGKTIVTGTQKDWPYEKAGPVEARLWDAKTGEPLAEILAFEDSITSAKYSADSSQVLIASDDHTARLFEVSTGKQIHKFDLGSRVQSIDFSPDGKTILTSSSGMTSNYIKTPQHSTKARVKLWDASTGELLLELPQPRSVSASFNPAGDQIVTACIGVITYSDIATGKQTAKLRSPLVGTQVMFSPNREYLVVFSPESQIELWSLGQRKPLGEFDLGESWYTGAVPYRSFFSPDHKTFYALGKEGELRSWSLEK